MIYFFALLTILTICFLRRKKDDEKILDKQSTTALKGIMCLYILLHNLGLDYQGNGNIAQLICDHSGTVAVSVFFFLSGYGVLMGYFKSKELFLKKLILNNTIKLYLVSLFINLLIYFTFFKGQIETKDLLLKIFNLDIFNNFNRMNRHGWFISTIIIMYITFSLIMFLFSKTKSNHYILFAVIIVSLVALSLRVCSQIFDVGGMYTKGLPCFGLGLLYAYFKETIDKFAFKYIHLIVPLGLIISSISYIFFWGTAAGYIINLVIVAVSTKYRYDNKIIVFIGKISLGIYLLLYYSTLILQRFVYNQYLWVLINSLLIFILSIILFIIMELISKLFNKLFQWKNKQCLN